MPDAPGDGASDWGLLEPLAFGSGSSALTGDDAVLAALIDVEAALAGAWADAGLAPAWLEEIASSLAGARVDRDALRRGARAGGNPVIPLVAALRDYTDRRRPGAGDWIHRGATSQDILDSALMLVASRAIVAVADRLDSLGARLAGLAEEHRESLMPGRTLTQHAAPITFGAKVAGWLDGVESAIAALGRIETPVQLAGSVGIGSSFVDLTGSPDAPAALRAGFAARLGLADPGRSWQAERSPVTGLAAALAITVGALGRIAADVLVLARTEVAEVAEVAEGGAGSSSAMPQKRNPATAVLIVAAAGRSPGLLSTLFSAMASADERAAGQWHSEWQAIRQLLALAVEASEASAALADGLVVDADRMRANLDLTAGLIYSEEVLSRLTRDRGRAEATAIVASAIDGQTPFAEAVPIELSTATTLAASATVVDAALARHADRLRKRDDS
ncbi:lyase family protein [Lacisediminihabitans sp.]|uniref:lyase family protein n=1 Tax=Lacisediminihabitans sp. TaxID=2787631 RepID=UPI00374CC091